MAKYGLYIHRQHQTKHGMEESGLVVLTKNGKPIGEYEYDSGGRNGKDSLPDRNSYTMEKEIAPFLPLGNKNMIPGLRITSEPGHLIHQAFDGVTSGCVGIRGQQWNKFMADYNAIPKHERPGQMNSLDDKQYANVRRGRDIDEKGGLFAGWFRKEKEEPKQERGGRSDRHDHDDRDDKKIARHKEPEQERSNGRMERRGKEHVYVTDAPRQRTASRNDDDNKGRTAEHKYNPIDAKVMQRVQDELGIKNVFKDGHITNKAQSELRDFQKDHGLKQTGALDDKTLKAMGINAKIASR